MRVRVTPLEAALLVASAADVNARSALAGLEVEVVDVAAVRVGVAGDIARAGVDGAGGAGILGERDALAVRLASALHAGVVFAAVEMRAFQVGLAGPHAFAAVAAVVFRAVVIVAALLARGVDTVAV